VKDGSDKKQEQECDGCSLRRQECPEVVHAFVGFELGHSCDDQQQMEGPCVLELDFVVLKCDEEQEQMTIEKVGDKWIRGGESRRDMNQYDSYQQKDRIRYCLVRVCGLFAVLVSTWRQSRCDAIPSLIDRIETLLLADLADRHCRRERFLLRKDSGSTVWVSNSGLGCVAVLGGSFDKKGKATRGFSCQN